MLRKPEHPLAARTEATPAAEARLPSGFQESTAFTGLTFPTNFRFSPDGRVFVAEKSGKIKVFDNLDDMTLSTLRRPQARGRRLLGSWASRTRSRPRGSLPCRTSTSSMYVRRAPGDTAPVWHDACPTPPGPTTDGCVVTGRLSRLTADGDTTTGTEDVLLEGWCQQYPSHSIGDLRFGPDGALYVSGGDGSNFDNVDVGQWGGTLPNPDDPVTPKNPCPDGGTTRSSLLTISAGNTAPEPVIDTPDSPLTWAVGDLIDFAGHARKGRSRRRRHG
jgi:glucose/arabinose dehydrogenase